MNRLPEPPAGPADRREELLELYALDLLDDAESAELERLVEREPEARERLRELRGVTAMLAFDVEPVEASPDLKERILRAARADLEGRAQATPSPPTVAEPISLERERAARRVGRTSWLGWAVAAVLAIALAGSALWNLQLRDELDERPDTVVHAVSGSDAAAGVTGEVLVIDGKQTIVTLSGLPQLEPGKVYQVWLISGQTPAPDVTFTPDTSGTASVGVTGSVAGADTLAITIERAGGADTPTLPVLIVSDLTGQS